MYLTYWHKHNPLKGKYYEINRKQNGKVYIHYGPMPRARSLPMGKFEVYIFKNNKEAINYSKKKVDEKLKKKYEVEHKNPSQIFKWMLNHTKPLLKNKT